MGSVLRAERYPIWVGPDSLEAVSVCIPILSSLGGSQKDPGADGQLNPSVC